MGEEFKLDDDITVKRISKEYNNEILDIIRNSPMVSRDLTMYSELGPDAFRLSDLQYDQYDYYGYFLKGKLEGLITVGNYQAYINGKKEMVTELANFFLNPSLRKKRLFARSSPLIFKDWYSTNNLIYSLVLKGNNPVESLAKANMNSQEYQLLPRYRYVGKYSITSCLLNFRKKESKQYKVRHATEKDIDLLVKLLDDEMKKRLFGLPVSRQNFEKNFRERPEFSIKNYFIAEKNGSLKGFCCAWSTMGMKKNVVEKYSSRFLPLRLGADFLSLVAGCPKLPRPGAAFSTVYITDYYSEGQNPEIMEALLRSVYNEWLAKRYNLMIFAAPEEDPLLKAVKAFTHQKISILLYIGAKEEKVLDNINTSSPYFDMALV
jgi:hypothetical protein